MRNSKLYLTKLALRNCKLKHKLFLFMRLNGLLLSNKSRFGYKTLINNALGPLKKAILTYFTIFSTPKAKIG